MQYIRDGFTLPVPFNLIPVPASIFKLIKDCFKSFKDKNFFDSYNNNHIAEETNKVHPEDPTTNHPTKIDLKVF